MQRMKIEVDQPLLLLIQQGLVSLQATAAGAAQHIQDQVQAALAQEAAEAAAVLEAQRQAAAPPAPPEKEIVDEPRE